LAITATGIGSGLDINSLVSQLIAIERQPLALLDQREITFQAELSAYGTLKGSLSSFQSTMEDLSSLAKYQGVVATVADSTIFTATANSTAIPSTYTVEVKQLAEAQKLTSSAFEATTDQVGSGTLSIQFGTFSGGVFSNNPEKVSQSIEIDSTQSSLNGIRDAINSADAGVSASILNDGNGYRLILTAEDTGAANSLKLTVTDSSDASDTDEAGLSRLAYDPEGSVGNGKNLSEAQTAQNSLIKVDGIDNISKAANEITDVIEGVTLNLLGKSDTGISTTLSLTVDTATVESAVRSFVQAYNGFHATIQNLTAFNAELGQGAILQGDSSALLILSRVRSTLSDIIDSPAGSFSTLSGLGITLQSDGSLALDEDRFQDVLDNNFGDIAALFANYTRTPDSFISYIGATEKTQNGVYDLNITTLATQGIFTGTATAALADDVLTGTFDTPLVIDADNDTFTVKIDNILSAQISLSQGTYASAAELSAELQARINNDTNLKQAAISVAVSFDSSTDKLTITSDRYGSVSGVEIVSVDTNTESLLGLAVGNGIDGVDVAGTIGGVSATGSGQVLTAAIGHDSENLAIKILGGSTGNRGTLTYSQGFAFRLAQVAEQLLDEQGPFQSRTDGINFSIEDLQDRRDQLGRRVELVEIRIRAQFNALDALLGRLNATSNFLTQQLANLPGSIQS
jgi:flagellar hook-associated protein 2